MRWAGGRCSIRAAVGSLIVAGLIAGQGASWVPAGAWEPAASAAWQPTAAPAAWEPSPESASPAAVARPLDAPRAPILHDAPDPLPEQGYPLLGPVFATDAATPPQATRPIVTHPPILASPDGLDATTAASYVLDPTQRQVRVQVDVTVVNRLPLTPGARYYYAGVNLAIQPEASQIVADEGGAHDKTTTQSRTGYRILTVEFASRLYVGQTTNVHLTYVLPAGAPRSSSQVRVGAAYATFVAWAFGDHGTVQVSIPSEYAVTVTGDAMTQGSTEGGLQVLTATANDPGSWYAWIDARNDSALTSQALQLSDGEQVVVRAWPEDATWQQRVVQTLTRGIPALVKRIGLPWPVSGSLSVLEVSGAQLEGYAGFYSPTNEQITISEDLDPLTIVHEASHAWFNSSLFANRWITEGLADEYAFRTLKGLGVAVDGPPDVRTSAAVAFPLDTWGPPAAIKTRTQDAREEWGYDASWTVVREIVSEVGETGMAKVFAAALAGTTAYVGSGTPERTTLPADWRRFADLAEEIGGGRGIAEMLAPWVLTSAERAQLAPRAAARTAYHQLLAASGGWSPPVVVRMDLDAWSFTAASSAIAEARLGLGVRDAMRSEAAREQLAVPAALETAYEGAANADALTGAVETEQSLASSLQAIAAARSRLAEPRDWIAGLGLVGEDPAGAFARAQEAWQAGNADTAASEAASVEHDLSVAADAGRLRLVAIIVALLALALIAVLGLMLARRRLRGVRPTPVAVIAAPADLSDPAPLPAAGDPRGWMDPGLAPPPPPPGWRLGAPSGPPATPGPYPILPPSATAGTSQGSPPHDPDGGAE